MRTLAGIFLLLHGLVHLLVWVVPFPPDAGAPFDPKHSWVLDRMGRSAAARGVAAGLATAAFATFELAGIGVLVDASWGPPLAAAGAGLSLVLTALYWHPWFALNLVINVAIIVLALR